MTTNTQPNTLEMPPPPPAWVNKMMRWMLRSPLHGIVSKNIMLINFTGRKSGKKFILPISYIQPNEATVLCSGDRYERNWWRNLRGGVSVGVRLDEKKRPFAEEITRAAKRRVLVKIKLQ